MPKYLSRGSYSADGLKGLQKDKASGRRTAVTKAVEGLGGKLEAFYYAFGEDDAIHHVGSAEPAIGGQLVPPVADLDPLRLRPEKAPTRRGQDHSRNSEEHPDHQSDSPGSGQSRSGWHG